MAAAAGEAIPTARTLGRSKMAGCCWATKEPSSLPVDYYKKKAGSCPGC
jgi:hypothetical protein